MAEKTKTNPTPTSNPKTSYINTSLGFTSSNTDDTLTGSTGLDGSRYNGGSEGVAGDHPYIKGYFYVFFGLPSNIFGEGSDSSKGTAQDYLMVSAENYTPPGDRTINLQDVQGQGGVDSSFITGQTITREFSIQYKDYWGAPIFRIHRKWTSYINPYTGVSDVATNFSAKEYKGVCMVIQTKPVSGRTINGSVSKDNGIGQFQLGDIIKVDLFDGVQPLTDLKSAYDASITDNSFVKPTVQYKFDGYPLDEMNTEVKLKALGVLNSKSMFEKTSKNYTKLVANISKM